MTRLPNCPDLYVTSGFIKLANEDEITGVALQDNVPDVILRGSRGRLNGLFTVGRLILATESDMTDTRITTHHVGPYQYSSQFEASHKPGTHPLDVALGGQDEKYGLIVPVPALTNQAATWALHRAAEKAADQLNPVSQAPRVDRQIQSQAGQEAHGIFDLLGSDSLAQALGHLTSRLQPSDKRQTPNELAGEFKERVAQTLRTGRQAVDMVDGAHTDNLPQNEQNPAHQPLSDIELDQLARAHPPITFRRN